MRGKSLIAAALLGVVAAGCGDSRGTAFQLVAPGTGGTGNVTSGAVSLTVGSGTSPSYTWTGGAARSLVVRASSGEVFWHIESLDLNGGFSAPVQHGVAPAGTRVVSAGRALIGGVQHTATVTVVGGATGSRSFTPQSIAAP